jgi:hypothetical protein
MLEHTLLNYNDKLFIKKEGKLKVLQGDTAHENILFNPICTLMENGKEDNSNNVTYVLDKNSYSVINDTLIMDLLFENKKENKQQTENEKDLAALLDDDDDDYDDNEVIYDINEIINAMVEGDFDFDLPDSVLEDILEELFHQLAEVKYNLDISMDVISDFLKEPMFNLDMVSEEHREVYTLCKELIKKSTIKK